MKGAVFDELFSWSERRPDWQRDALRRIVQGRSLDEGDIEQLVEICKRGHGLSIVELSANPLERAHIPTAGSEIAGPVVLTKLVHNANVNALAPAQTVEFAEHGLTIIFGNNAAGKSGYTRILKDACRARGAAETILTNVLAESMPSKLSAGIFYRSGDGAEERFNWTGDSAAPEPLSDVSVFDSQAAAVYVAEKTDVPFRPFGLDIFDKLAGACEAVRKAIDKERKAHSSAAVGLPELDAETAAGKLLGNLSALTPVAEVEALGTLSDAEEERLASLDAELARAKIEDPTVRARSLRRRATVLDELVSHGQALTGQLGKDAVDGLRKLHAEEAAATGTAQAGHGIASSQPLEGIGTASWRAMWGAAKAFSEQHAYPSVPFPATESGDRCVLCQQDLEESARERLVSLAEWLNSELEQQAAHARRSVRTATDGLRDLVCAPAGIVAALDELSEEDEELADLVRGFLDEAERCQAGLLDEVHDDGAVLCRSHPDAAIAKLAASLRERADAVEAAADPEHRVALEREVAALRGRAKLRDLKAVVLGEIERQKRLGAYELCIKDTSSNAVTRKSTELTKKYVTDALAAAFRAELDRLHFKHVELELRAAGGRQGTLFHQVHFKRADADVRCVVSEGEARCLAIAAFLAELSTTHRKSAILLDDPVSSLDHLWRQRVAERLAEEAKERQVVIFSHDIVFLVALIEHAAKVGAAYKTQYLRREAGSPGHCSPELPWPALKVKARVGKLKNLAVAAAKAYKEHGSAAYESRAQQIYGLLREAWERAVEEILLNGVVERFRNSVETHRARNLANITDEDLRTIEEAMTKCSTWLSGHDQAAAQNTPIPEPDELMKDIEGLEAWVKEARGRLVT